MGHTHCILRLPRRQERGRPTRPHLHGRRWRLGPAPWGGLRCQDHPRSPQTPAPQPPVLPPHLDHSLGPPSRSGLRLASGVPPCRPPPRARSEGVGDGGHEGCWEGPESRAPTELGNGEQGGRCVRREGRGGPYPQAAALGARTAQCGPPGRAAGRARRREPLGGTGPASSGHSPGSRDRRPHLGRKQRGQQGQAPGGSPVPAPPPPPAWLRARAGWALPPARIRIAENQEGKHQNQEGKHRSLGGLSELACPTRSPGTRSRGCRPKGRKLTLTVRHPRPGRRSASTSCRWPGGGRPTAASGLGVPGGWGSGLPRAQVRATHLPRRAPLPSEPALPAHSPRGRAEATGRCPRSQSRPRSTCSWSPAEEPLGVGDRDGGSQPPHVLWIKTRAGVEGWGAGCSPNQHCQEPRPVSYTHSQQTP